jgi:hypothetical protein
MVFVPWIGPMSSTLNRPEREDSAMTLVDELIALHGAKNPSKGLAAEICEAFNVELRAALNEAIEKCAQESERLDHCGECPQVAHVTAAIRKLAAHE